MRTLLRVGVIDLEAQRPNFGRIAKVAKALFGAPVADVTIIHQDFMWSSREQAMREHPSDSPSAIAMAQDEVYWIEDASKDPLWRDHPVVAREPFVRFYAGAPIVLEDGQRLGALCVMHIEPMAYDKKLADRLMDLARIIAQECGRERERQDLIRAQQRLNTAVKLGQLHVWEMDYEAEALFKMGAEDSFYETPVTFEDVIKDPYGGIHEDDVERAKAAFASKERGPPLECRVRRTDGKTVWAAFTARPIIDEAGRISRLIGVMQNITARKEAEGALIEARDQAETANRAKSNFLANMSHELRTPLNGVTGVAEALGRTALSGEQKEMVGIIEASARTLETLLSDLLDFSSLESGNIALKSEPFDLVASARACAAPYGQMAHGKGLSLDVEISDAARGQWLGDASRIRQILLHLLSNAVKFTSHGKVSLSVDADAWGIVFKVSDTGIGFDAETKARLFRSFEQADGSITRRYGGTGMGLALSQALANAMGASLDAKSKPGKGSTFVLRIPCQKIETSQDAPVPEADDQDERPMRVLVAEDHPTNRKVVEIMLSAFGVDLTFAENGQEAVDAFKRSRFDLVFMDMQMPVMDGLTAIREIRAIEKATGRGHTPVYTLTANALPEHAEASFTAGSDGHVTKPVTSETLLGVLVAAAQANEEAVAKAA